MVFQGGYIAFAAVAVFAVGLAVYEFVSQRNRQRYRQRRPPNRPVRRFPPDSDDDLPGPNDHPPVPGPGPDDHPPAPGPGSSRIRRRCDRQPDSSPKELSITVENSSKCNSSEKSEDVSNLRKRKNSSEESKEEYEKSNLDKNTYEKKVYEKFKDETVNANTKAKSFNKNVFEDDSDSENTDIKIHNTITDNGCETNQSNVVADPSNEVISDSLPELDKTEVLSVSLESEDVSQGTSFASEDDTRTEQKESFSFIQDQGICNGCEINQSNAVARPCGHCYLCSDCASIILRIYDKCTICHGQITKFDIQSLK